MDKQVMNSLEVAAIETVNHLDVGTTVYIFPDYILWVSPEGVRIEK